MQEERRLWTYKDVCRRLNIRPGTAYAWVSQGRLPVVRFSSKMVRFDPDEIEEWIAAQTESNWSTVEMVR